MKKILLALTILAYSQTEAQVSFKPGLKAGYTASRLTNLDADYKSDFYVGAYGLLKLTKVYNMQFEMMYLRQGVSNFKWTELQYGDYTRQTLHNDDINLNYISLNFINKFNIDKFSFHVGPGLDILISDNNSTNYDYNSYEYNNVGYSDNAEVDLTLNLGVGYQITPNLGIEGRMRIGVVEPVYFNNSYNQDYHANQSFQVGLNYTFK